MTEPAHHAAERRKPVAEVRLTDETIAYLEERIAAAVGNGIKTAIIV